MYDRNLALEAVRVTEAAAIACLKLVGRGDKMAADGAATDALRDALNRMDIRGTVVIGEGEMDEAPMLYIGEEVGTGNGPEVDIALDPLEGTTPCADGMDDSTSVIAFAEKGKFLNAPDIYMEKIAVGGGLPAGVISLAKTPKENIIAVAKAKGVSTSEITLCTLKRDRHQYIVDDARSLGARIKFIENGDVGGVLSTALVDSPVDIYIGKGGAPEGVIGAAALVCLGGQMEAKLTPEDDAEIARCHRWDITDLEKIYTLDELASGDVMFCATGITDGPMAKGVYIKGDRIVTETLMMRSKTGTMRRIHAEHNLDRKDWVKA